MTETSQGELGEVIDRLRHFGTDLTRVEVKSAAGGIGRSVWDTVRAFSNTRAGLVLLGLDESYGFRPATGFDPLRIRDAVVTGLAESVRPRPIAHADLIEVEGAPVVVVDVEELPAADKPCFVVSKSKESGSYERRADGDHRMSTYQVFLHPINVNQPQDDVAAVEGAEPGDLDPDMITRMFRRLRTAGRRVVADLQPDVEALRRLDVLVRNRDDVVPTVAGRIEMFPDRVEVINAGGIWGGCSESDLLDGVSRSWNEKSALLLQDVPFPDRDEVVCENKGSGIPRMAGLMRGRGPAIPRLRDRTTSFTVTLDRHGLLDPFHPSPAGIDRRTCSFHSGPMCPRPGTARRTGRRSIDTSSTWCRHT